MTAAGLRSAVFLDRDGVINQMVYNAEFGLVDSPQNPDEFVLLPGAAEAVRRINELGFLAVVVSNQPAIAKGKCTQDLLNFITEKMTFQLSACGARLDAVYYCLHHPDAKVAEYRVACDCRKPRPGLILRASSDLCIDPVASFIIGDGLTDILAGKSVGCRTVLLGNLKCDLCRTMDALDAHPDLVASDLQEAVAMLAGDVSSAPTLSRQSRCC